MVVPVEATRSEELPASSAKRRSLPTEEESERQWQSVKQIPPSAPWNRAAQGNEEVNDDESSVEASRKVHDHYAEERKRAAKALVPGGEDNSGAIPSQPYTYTTWHVPSCNGFVRLLIRVTHAC